jgi:integrase
LTIARLLELDILKTEESLPQLIAKMRTFSDAFVIVYNYHFYDTTRNGKDQICRFNLYLQGPLGNVPLKEISPLMLEDLKIALLKKKLKPHTIYHIFSVVSTVYNKLIGWECYDGRNPTKNLKLKKVDNRRTRALAKAESRVLLDALKERSHETYLIALMSISTGMRAGEIFSLTGDRINLDTRIIQIMDTKTDINRLAIIPDELAEELSKISLKRGRLVFPKKVGEGKKTEVSNAFAKVVDELGFNDGITDARNRVVFHTLRHSFASILAQSGQTIVCLADILGHRTLEMSKRYCHLTPEERKAAAAIMNAFLS